jgi:hypothetical protein
MKKQTKTIIALGMLALYLVSIIGFASALVVDADYVTTYSGEEVRINLEIENNEDFDIEDISIALELGDVPFSSVGSSEKDVDDIDENDDDKVSFTLKASSDIVPGDYDIPYEVKFYDAENDSDDREKLEKKGSFGLRVSAKTELSFNVETDDAIVGKQGKVSLKIVNRGLGDIKAVSVKLNPSGFELLSAKEEYIGTVDSDSDEIVSFDIIFKETNPKLNAVVQYKDFDNKEHSERVTLPFKVYTTEEALELGLIKKSNTPVYAGVLIAVVLIWFIYRKIRKSMKKKKSGR